MNKTKQLIIATVFSTLVSCGAIESTPEELKYGTYQSNQNSDQIIIVNDSLAYFRFQCDGITYKDSMVFVYIPPLQETDRIGVGNLCIKSEINDCSKLYKYSLEHRLNPNNLFYAVRYGKYRILPDPETTDLSFDLVERN